jgi:prolyl-tRNA synthetase
MATNQSSKDLSNAESVLADICQQAELADHSPVKGCMVIRPYGYAIWENIKFVLDAIIKVTGHQNAYFPMLVPESFLTKEAEHVEGFAPECAVVTQAGGKELAEKYVIRPTSETIINHMFSKWINSYRDLPLKLNQWANVMRWEMRTRMFLRTSEFLWQEGHTCHATHAEAEEEVALMINEYKKLLEDYLALPVHVGKKTESEKFAGAVSTYTIEALMRDGKALQAGTSHDLGQNFAKAFETKFTTEDNQQDFVWQTSWGVSTRLIGALIMGHHDEVGLVLPPRIAPYQVVIIPIIKKNLDNSLVLEQAEQIAVELAELGIRYHLDDKPNISQGKKFQEYEQKGVPLRLVLGPKDLENGEVEIHRRDLRSKEKGFARAGIADTLANMLAQIQHDLFERACQFRTDKTVTVSSIDELEEFFNKDIGFAKAMWNGDVTLEKILKEKFQASIRCLPNETTLDKLSLPCIISGDISDQNVEILIAKAY